jgi:molecular chaperone DnaK
VNGILSVSAKDKATGKSQNIRIEASSGLSKDEIEKMKREAEMNAEADKKAKEETEKINQADSMIFQTEKQLKEFGDKLPVEKKAPIESALEELKKAHASKDVPAIDKALEAMNTAWSAASQEMYQAMNNNQQQGAQGASADGQENKGGSGKNDSEVTDVDFEEVK